MLSAACSAAQPTPLPEVTAPARDVAAGDVAALAMADGDVPALAVADGEVPAFAVAAAGVVAVGAGGRCSRPHPVPSTCSRFAGATAILAL